jgi:hypothetical protein
MKFYNNNGVIRAHILMTKPILYYRFQTGFIPIWFLIPEKNSWRYEDLLALFIHIVKHKSTSFHTVIIKLFSFITHFHTNKYTILIIVTVRINKSMNNKNFITKDIRKNNSVFLLFPAMLLDSFSRLCACSLDPLTYL